MHDIYETIPTDVDCYVYADDIFLYSADVSHRKVVDNLERELFKVSSWAKEWNLCISPEKSKSIIFSGKKSCEENFLKLDGVSIPTEDHVKILGMWFDSKLSWNFHINKIVPKLERMLNAFKFIASPKCGVRKVDLVNIANATIRGRIEYGSCLLISASQQNKKKLEIVYNHALRLTTGAPISTFPSLLYVEAGVFTLDTRRSIAAIKFVIKNIALSGASPIADSLKSCLLSCKYKWGKIRKPISQRIKDKLSSLDLHFRVGIAAVDRTAVIVGQCMDSRSSIFSAEAWPLYKLLEKLNPNEKVAILTDSKSVVSAMSCVNRRSNSLILKLFEWIKAFHHGHLGSWP
ncbi:RNA-directed DNA polymerase from mobile element jockey, partial [Stegodyphus mimosarum]